MKMTGNNEGLKNYYINLQFLDHKSMFDLSTRLTYIEIGYIQWIPRVLLGGMPQMQFTYVMFEKSSFLSCVPACVRFYERYTGVHETISPLLATNFVPGNN